MTSQASILLVDDDIFNLYSLNQLIHSFGNFKIEKAVNGQDAIIAIKKRYKYNQQVFSLIMMYINMPVMDGVTAIRILRELH